jgi:hypothetical protein
MSALFSFAFLPSSQLTVQYEYDQFHAQDDVDLGKGSVTRIGLQKSFRIGYPDISATLFAEFGRFDETEGTRGTIDNLNPFPGELLNALPDDYDNYGLTLSYGMQNANIYTGVWRPYIELSPFYNRQLEQTNFSVNAGLGGAVYNQDHMILGVDYNQAVNGTQEQYLKLFMQYKLLY